MKETHFSREVIENAKELMLSAVSNDIDSENEDLDSKNIEFMEFLINEHNTSIIALSSHNELLFNNEKKDLKKETYRFPLFIKCGNLVTWNTTPSRILNEKMFKTKIPFLIPTESPLGFIQDKKYKDEVISVIESIGLKMISSIPTGLAQVIIFDKTGAGQNFPTLMRLDSKFTGDKIITEDDQIEKELENIKFSMASVTGSITGNGFESVDDYNNKTDEVPQQYKFLFISGFPLGFSKKATESLISILESGRKAGVYTFMSLSLNMKNGKSQMVSGVSLEDIIKYLTLFEFSEKPNDFMKKKLINENVYVLNVPFKNEHEAKHLMNNTFKIDFERPGKEFVDNRVRQLNEDIEHINVKPVISIEKTLPKPENYWKHSSGSGVSIPFAKNGIEDIFISLGVNQYGEDEGTHHGLIGGSTGSGKTVLLHDIILQASLRYSPKDLNFWLLDYKEGTEFATYRDFPHVQILSMESEIEFGQEVLQNAINLIKKRGDMFKELSLNAGVTISNLKSYNDTVGESKILPRIVIIIDEFQALFPKQPRITSKTNELIDDILRRGRSFGINLLMATQTLKGVDMDAQLMSNMPLRIGLKMDAKDVNKLFDEGNNAPKSLSNPGEGIYNKQFGLSSANSFFQAYYASNDAVDRIKDKILNYIEKEYSHDEINKLLESRFVYSGDKESLISSNDIFMKKVHDSEKFDKNKIYIGEYAGLSKEHSYFTLHREFSENIILVGSDIRKAAEIFYYTLYQLIHNEKEYKIYLANFNKSFETSFKGYFSEAVTFINNQNHIDYLNEIMVEFNKRKTLEDSEIEKLPRIFMANFFIDSSLLISDGSPGNKSAQMFLKLISEGPELGIHSFFYGTDISSFSAIGISRSLDKFKKRIAIPGMGNSLKIFGEESSNIQLSKSKHVLIATSGEINSGIFKFKPYIKEGIINDSETL